MKKTFAVFLAILLLFACMPLGAVPVMAATSGTTGDCTWVLENGHLIISGEGAMEDYDRGVGPWGSSITSVSIGDGVTAIGERTFYRCRNLNSVTIPDSVTTIGDYAFFYCESLTSVTIPNSVISIGAYAFSDCLSLTDIDTEANNPNFSSLEGVLFNKEQTTLIQYPGGKFGDYTIPDSVTSIGENAFRYCESLTSVTIGKGVTTIGKNAFYYCTSLTSVTISNNVTIVGEWAFANCDSLTIVSFGNSVTSIGRYAFYKCTSLTSVTIPNSVITIGERTFYCCTSLASVAIPDSVTTIGEWAFANCDSLSDVYYAGNETDKTNIAIGPYNNDFINATWHYTIIYGDANGDGVVSARDVALLQKYLADWGVTVDAVAADVNATGKISARDLALLQQYLAGWDVTLGPV